MDEATKNRNRDNKIQDGSTLVWWGVAFLLLGAIAFVKPIFYFRGGMIDFTGFNHLVGIGLFVFGFVSIVVGARK